MEGGPENKRSWEGGERGEEFILNECIFLTLIVISAVGVSTNLILPTALGESIFIILNLQMEHKA